MFNTNTKLINLPKEKKHEKKKRAFLHSLCKKEGHQKPHFAEVPNLVTCPSLGKTK